MIDLSVLTSDFCESFGAVSWGYTEEDIPRTYNEYHDWVDRGLAKPLHYLEDERKIKRSSLKSVYPDFACALVFLFDYNPQIKTDTIKLAHYTLAFDGLDYHHVLRERLHQIGMAISHDQNHFKVIIDVEPVLERDLAYRSGQGWFGKNSMLINQKHGSYFLIGSLLFNTKAVNPPLSHIEVDHCGHCTACIDKCPTDAISENERTIITERCISTFTIEIFKESSPPKGYVQEKEIFGCDICQDVCPWNRKIELKDYTSEKSIMIKNFFYHRPLREVVRDLKNMSGREYKRKFKHTSLERTGLKGLIKNLIPFL